MFTGIIEATARLIERSDSGLVLERPKNFNDLKNGCSIAVSGVCLTVTTFDKNSMSFDVVPVTFEKSKLGSLKKGDFVNLERAMRADARFDGHIVQGHCEGVGLVVATGRAPTPGPSPGSFDAAASSDKPGEGSSVTFNELQGRVIRSLGSLRYPPKVIVQHARAMRKVPTKAEEKLWNALRGKKVEGLYFRRQRPIGPFIVDFYCEEKKLGIEVDGGFHKDPVVQESDALRELYLQRRGISILRFSNEEILENLQPVFAAIKLFDNRASLTQLHEDERSDAEGLGEGSRVGASREMESTELDIQIPPSLLPFIIPQGSITLDGVALTVAAINNNQITVALIPTTLALTALGSLKKGDAVNIETDILGRYILKSHGAL